MTVIRVDIEGYAADFDPDEGGSGFTVTFSALPGIVTQGDTFDEARAMAQDALGLYLLDVRDDLRDP